VALIEALTLTQAEALPSASRLPATTMRAPSLAKAMAEARPIPVRAPVIKTTGVLMFLILTVCSTCQAWPAKLGQLVDCLCP